MAPGLLRGGRAGNKIQAYGEHKKEQLDYTVKVAWEIHEQIPIGCGENSFDISSALDSRIVEGAKEKDRKYITRSRAKEYEITLCCLFPFPIASLPIRVFFSCDCAPLRYSHVSLTPGRHLLVSRRMASQ